MMQEHKQPCMIIPGAPSGKEIWKIRQEKRVLDFEEDNEVYLNCWAPLPIILV